jgi:Ran GTPase-activating protein (RanGAP) involved in mRNA processing and transport
VNEIAELEDEDSSCKLSQLDIFNNPCFYDSCSAHIFAKALTKNETLTALTLDDCDLKDLGMAHLSAALLINRTLRELRIVDNTITDLGAFSIATALAHNSELESLTLSSPDIGSPGANAISNTDMEKKFRWVYLAV